MKEDTAKAEFRPGEEVWVEAPLGTNLTFQLLGVSRREVERDAISAARSIKDVRNGAKFDSGTYTFLFVHPTNASYLLVADKKDAVFVVPAKWVSRETQAQETVQGDIQEP